MNPEEENPTEREITERENTSGEVHNRSGEVEAYMSSISERKSAEENFMIRRPDDPPIDDIQFPLDFEEEEEEDDEEWKQGTQVFSRERSTLFPIDEEAPSSEYASKEEENNGAEMKVDTVEEFMGGHLEQRIAVKDAEYPKNIVQNGVEEEVKNNPTIAMLTTQLSLPKKELYSKVPTIKESANLKEDPDEILTNPAEDIPEKLEVLRVEYGCQMCAGYKDAFTTTIIICIKCLQSIMKKKRGKHICRWIVRFVFVVLLAIIATLSYYVSIADCDNDEEELTEKYEYVLRDLQYTKEILSQREFQFRSIIRSYHTCQMREPEFKLVECEKTMAQMKGGLEMKYNRTSEKRELTKRGNGEEAKRKKWVLKSMWKNGKIKNGYEGKRL